MELQSNSHIVHWTQTAGSANLKVQNLFHGQQCYCIIIIIIIIIIINCN